ARRVALRPGSAPQPTVGLARRPPWPAARGKTLLPCGSSMAQLSDEELREAAAEAGISPHELRHALAQREGTDLARPDDAGTLMGPPERGASEAHVVGRIGRPPGQAIAAVRASIERQTGRTGHRQGEHAAAVENGRASW